MKELITILLTFLILNSCSVLLELEDVSIDEKLAFCYLSHQGQMHSFHGDSIESAIYLNVYSAFENFLLSSKYLDGIDKKSYFDLLDKIENGHLEADLKKDLGKDYYIFEFSFFTPSGYVTDLTCYDFLIEYLQLVKVHDFRYKIYKLLLQKDKEGSIFNFEDMRELIKLIPKYEFNKIIYRNILIKEIYLNLNDE